MDRSQRTYFVSDVHLGLEVKNAAAREERFVSFLRSIRSPETAALYLLGDIWDFWYEYRDVVPKGYVRVLAALTDLMDDGIPVYFFQGNHDIWTYRYFEELGMVSLTQPCEVRIGNQSFCLGHGDGLGPGMQGYKVMRWCFHNRTLQALFSTLHPRIAFGIGKSWSRSSRLGKSIEYTFRGPQEPLYRFCTEYIAHQPVNYFIFGHYHCRVDMTLPGGARLLVLKDWMDGSSWLSYSPETGLDTSRL